MNIIRKFAKKFHSIAKVVLRRGGWVANRMCASLQVFMARETVIRSRCSRHGVSFTLFTYRDDVVLGGTLRGQFELWPDIEAELEQFVKFIKPGSKVLDVGANLGYYSVISALREPGACFHSIEPDSENFSLLQLNIIENKIDNVTPHHVAIGHDRGFLSMHRSPDNFGDHRSSAPIGETKSFTLAGAPSYCIEAEHYFRNLIKFGGVFDLVKIDTQGAEYAVIQSILPLLDEKSVVFVEFSPWHLLQAGVSCEGFIELLRGFSSMRRVLFEDGSSGLGAVNELELEGLFEANRESFSSSFDLVLSGYRNSSR